MTDTEQRVAAAKFTEDWKSRGDEKQETQRFWIELLTKVFGVDGSTAISFEVPVKLDHTSFIDGYIESTRVLIEQKGRDIDLRKGYKQSDGSMLTPYQQARRYAGYLPYNQVPRWIVVCNFQEFQIHDMNRPNDEPEVLKLADLEKEYHRLQFLVDTGSEHIKKEMEISLQAGELVGVLYDALLKQYKDPSDPETLKSLNKLCVRLVFCLYAEDAGIFGGKSMFHDYLERHRSEDRRALINLFRVLDQDTPQRDKYLDDDLAEFPYVNGGLFADDAEMVNLASKALRLNAILFVTFGFQMVYASLYLSIGKSLVGGLLSLSRQGIFFLPLIYVLPRLFQLSGVIWVQPAADLLTTAVTFIFAIKINRALTVETSAYPQGGEPT